MTLYAMYNCNGTEITYDVHGVMDNGNVDLREIDPESAQSFAELVASGDLTRSIFIYEVATGDLAASVLATE